MATHLNVQLKTVRNLKATATFFNFLSFKKKKRKERRKERKKPRKAAIKL